LAEADMSRVPGVKRDRQKVHLLVGSIASNNATIVGHTTLEKDIKIIENSDLSRPTIIE
jgi:hypothetical protein